MAVQLIGYDLNSPRDEDDYTELIKAIKELGAWCHILDSTWLVRSEMSSKGIRDSLQNYLDSGDELFVVKVTDEWASVGLSKVILDWLHSHF